MGEDELAWRPRLMRELDNLRAAVSWSLDAENSRGPGARDPRRGGVDQRGELGHRPRGVLVGGTGAPARRAVSRRSGARRLQRGGVERVRWRPRRRGRPRRGRPPRTGAGLRRCTRPCSSLTWRRSATITTRRSPPWTEGTGVRRRPPETPYAEFGRATLLLGIAGMKLTRRPRPGVGDCRRWKRRSGSAQAWGNPTAIANAPCAARGLADRPRRPSYLARRRHRPRPRGNEFDRLPDDARGAFADLRE